MISVCKREVLLNNSPELSPLKLVAPEICVLVTISGRHCILYQKPPEKAAKMIKQDPPMETGEGRALCQLNVSPLFSVQPF